MNKSLDTKIAIIGAGPSGLAAAEALREKGYKNITVFEKNKCVGGQSLTCEYVTPDNRVLKYDIGSIQPLSTKTLKRLFKKYGLSFGRGPLESRAKVFYGYDLARKEEFVNYLKYFFGLPLKYWPHMTYDMAKLSYYLWKYRRLAKPGFYGFKYWGETSDTAGDWIEKKNFKVLGERLYGILMMIMTLENRNNADNVKMYMAWKAIYYMLLYPMRYIDGTYMPVKEGFQELWTRVSKNFEVILNADIKSIVRSDSRVIVEANSNTYHFDELIVSCGFDRIAHLIDARPEEKEVFRNIHYNPGYRGAFVAKNGPIDRVTWYPLKGRIESEYLSTIFPEGKVDEHTYLYSCMFSHCPDVANTVQALKDSASKTLKEQFNAEITEWVRVQHWSDFNAVFDVEMARTGVYDRIQAMQGVNRTYYTGQLMSQSGHAATVDYSYELIDLFY